MQVLHCLWERSVISYNMFSNVFNIRHFTSVKMIKMQYHYCGLYGICICIIKATLYPFGVSWCSTTTKLWVSSPGFGIVRLHGTFAYCKGDGLFHDNSMSTVVWYEFSAHLAFFAKIEYQSMHRTSSQRSMWPQCHTNADSRKGQPSGTYQ